MTTELTKAAQQALHAFDADDDFAVSMAMDAIRAALTTSQPAPTSQDLERAAKMCDGFAAPDMAAALRGQPAQAGEVDGPIAASLGDIVAAWDQHAPSEYMTAIHMQAKRALAGQQPVSPDMARWCAYVGGMVAHWVTSEPDAHARLGDDAFEAAIAGIIERRLWAMPKPAPQQATPEPSRGMIGMGSQALASELSAAVVQDNIFPEDHDMAAGKFGPNVSAWLRKVATEYLSKPATPPQQAAGEPVLYVSQKQAESIRTTKREWYTPEGTHGRYLPVRAEPSGLFTMPLYAAHPAPGVPEGFAMVPYPPEGHGYVLVRVDTGIKDGWCFCTPKNHPEDVARGLTDSEYDDSAQFFGNVLAAAQAKGGRDEN